MIDWTHSCPSVPTGFGSTYRSYTPYLYGNQPLAPHFELNRPIKNPSTFLGGLALDFLALLLLNIAWIEQLLQFNLRCTLFEFPCIQFKTTRIGDTIFYVSYWRRNRHFTWSSKPREGPAICWAKEVPSFLSCFSWLFWDPGYLVRPQESNPLPSALQSRFLPTELILPRFYHYNYWNYEYMKTIYVNCGVKNYLREDHRSYIRNFCSCEKKFRTSLNFFSGFLFATA